MVGYGSEDDHFVVELTYNYGIGSYKLGNDFLVRFRRFRVFFLPCILYTVVPKLFKLSAPRPLVD